MSKEFDRLKSILDSNNVAYHIYKNKLVYPGMINEPDIFSIEPAPPSGPFDDTDLLKVTSPLSKDVCVTKIDGSWLTADEIGKIILNHWDLIDEKFCWVWG